MRTTAFCEANPVTGHWRKPLELVRSAVVIDQRLTSDNV